MATNGGVNLVLLFGPFAVYFLLLVVYYVWEGRRERRLRAEYEAEEATRG